jgi:hypothetical protein
MELDISIEGAWEQIEFSEAKEDRKKFEEGNKVSMVVILAPITTQPIVVEKTQEIEKKDIEQVKTPKLISDGDILTNVVATIYGMDVAKDTN